MNRKQRARCEEKLLQIKKENSRLRTENARLRESLRQKNLCTSPLVINHSSLSAVERKLYGERHRAASLFSASGYLRYLYEIFHTSVPFKRLARGFSYFRRYRMAILFLQVLLFLLTLPKTGTLLIAASALSAVLLPAATVFFTVLLRVFSLRRRREKRRLTEALRTCTQAYVFFLPRDEKKESSAFLSFLSALSERGNTAILTVSPYLFSYRGISPHPKHRTFVAARMEAPNVFLLRANFYFSLRKHSADFNRKCKAVFF